MLPDVLPYVVGTPAVFGFATRNGRTLADNAPEAMLSVVTNMGVAAGLTPGIAADLRRPEFPYVVPVNLVKTEFARRQGAGSAGPRPGRLVIPRRPSHRKLKRQRIEIAVGELGCMN